MGEKASFLNDITDAAAEADGVPIRGSATVDEDVSRIGEQHAVDEPEKRGLPAAAAAEKDERFAGRNGERDIGDKGAGGGAVGRGCATGDAAKLDYGFVRIYGFRIHFY